MAGVPGPAPIMGEYRLVLLTATDARILLFWPPGGW